MNMSRAAGVVARVYGGNLDDALRIREVATAEESVNTDSRRTSLRTYIAPVGSCRVCY